MSDYYVRRILTDYQVNQIRELLHDNNSYWESGLKTFGYTEVHKKIKNNEMLSGPREILNQIHDIIWSGIDICLLYTSPSPRDRTRSRMPSSA